MKLLTTILFILLPLGVYSQTYTIDPALDSIRTYAFNKLSIPASGTKKVTTVKANRIINESIGRICDDFPAYEKVCTLFFSVDSDGVAMPDDFLRVRSAYKIPDSIKFPLRYYNSTQIADNFNTPEKNTHMKKERNSPTHYYTHGLRFFTHPKNLKPSTDRDTIVVEYYAIDSKLSSGGDSTVIRPMYMDDLMNLVCSELSLMRDDFDKYTLFLNRYEKAAKPEPLKEDK